MVQAQPIHDWFSEGFDWPELKAAKSILAELKSTQRLLLIPIVVLVPAGSVEVDSVSRRSSIKALVIGASGHLGNAIVRDFLDRNYRITACGRRGDLPANPSNLPVRYLSGDTETSRQLDEWIAGHDLVVDAAAPYPLSAFSPVSESGKDPIAHAERRTRLLLDAVCRHKARLVYVGSFVTLVKPRTSTQRFPEYEMMRLAHPYFEVKELIESKVIEASRRGLPVVIANPTYCLGPWDLHDRQLCTIPLLLRGDTIFDNTAAERDRRARRGRCDRCSSRCGILWHANTNERSRHLYGRIVFADLRAWARTPPEDIHSGYTSGRGRIRYGIDVGKRSGKNAATIRRDDDGLFVRLHGCRQENVAVRHYAATPF